LNSDDHDAWAGFLDDDAAFADDDDGLEEDEADFFVPLLVFFLDGDAALFLEEGVAVLPFCLVPCADCDVRVGAAAFFLLLAPAEVRRSSAVGAVGFDDPHPMILYYTKKSKVVMMIALR